MPLTVHHLGISQSDRVVWLCEELGLDYALQKYDRAPLLAPADYKALHPVGSSPVLQDGDLTLAESAACVEYLCQIHGGGRLVVKPGEKNYADYLYWFHFANGTFVPALARLMTASPDATDELTQRSRARAGQLLSFVNERLGRVPWLAGAEFTAADVMNVCCLTTMRCFVPVDLAPYPHVLAYLGRVAAREAYVRAMQKGDPELRIEELIAARPPPMQHALKQMLKGQKK
ncbi:glutathione S-transferase [Xylariomycetidae sp. FL0641]|nr:glutathione S-transferase [Xylariomycetidae sp. FL0641]